jgi:hypothetical protein
VTETVTCSCSRPLRVGQVAFSTCGPE